MKEMGLQVGDKEGEPLTFARAVVRFLAQHLLFVITLGISGLWVVWDRQRQTLHDKLAGTRIWRIPRSWEKPVEVRIFED